MQLGQPRPASRVTSRLRSAATEDGHHVSRFTFHYWPPPTFSCKTVAKQMALESKPLFHPEAIRQQVRAFNLPERVGDWQPKLQHWAGLIASGRADDFKETALLRSEEHT